MNEPDDLRRRLDHVAASIDVGDLEVQAVHSKVRRRRLRVRLGAALGVSALVAATTVAVVALNADDDPDTISTAVVEAPDDSSPNSQPTVDDTTPAPADIPASPARTVQTIERPGSVGQRVGVGGAPEYGEWSVGWQDGFLVGAQSFTPQPLPDELPEEVLALFPQEVRDVFGGELPATISEATQMLSDAGLLDTVADIIAANPSASDAIYSVQTDETPTLDVRFTTDGVTWKPVEMTLPPGASYFNSVTVVDGRIVVSYGSLDPFTGLSADGIARVASTENLLDWTVQEIVIPPPPIELPAGAAWSVSIGSLASNERGWVASVYAGIEVDPVALVPEEIRTDFEQSTDGYSSSVGETGVSLESSGAGGSQTVEFTWEELGVSPEAAEYISGQRYEPAMWAATWDGDATASQGPGPTQQIVATPAGFVAFDDQVWYSADGGSWTAAALPVEDGYVSSSFTFDGGIIALVGTSDGTRTLRLDERGGSPEWLDIPGLPENPQAAFGYGGRLGVVMDAVGYRPPLPPLVVEADGHRLTIDNTTGGIEVVELSTGEIVATANFGRGIDDDASVSFDSDGITVTDPATGEVVVVFPADELEAANEALYENGPMAEPQEYNPDMWLLATLDGETFVLEDLDDGNGDSYYGPGVLATNGSRFLLQTGGNWVVYDLS